MAKSSWVVILAGVTVAVGALYVSRRCSFGAGCEAGTAINSLSETKARPKKQSGADLRSLAPNAAICVNPVKNLSGQAVDMDRIDEQLAAEIGKTGYRGAKIGDLACDAITYTEITHVSQGKRAQAELEFRLVLAGEQAPRFSATAKGQSESGELRKFADPFVASANDKAQAQHDAILAAFADQARKIQLAQRDGMAPYAGVQQQ